MLEHADAKSSVEAWVSEVRAAKWRTSAELKERYPKASILDAERVWFDIHGNRYRLLVSIDYETGTVVVQFAGTHQQYDRFNARNA